MLLSLPVLRELIPATLAVRALSPYCPIKVAVDQEKTIHQVDISCRSEGSLDTKQVKLFDWCAHRAPRSEIFVDSGTEWSSDYLSHEYLYHSQWANVKGRR